MRNRTRIFCALACVAMVAPMFAQEADYHSNPDFQKAMAEAKESARKNDAIWAINAYRKANKRAGGKCAECLNEIIRQENKIHDYGAMVKDSEALAALMTTPAQKSRAQYTEGVALFHAGGENPKMPQLQKAHDVLLASMASDPAFADPHFMDGLVLAHMKQDDAAKAEFLEFLDLTSRGTQQYAEYRRRAKHFAEEPQLARERMAPPFNVMTLDGRPFSLDSMNGKVVLIDFWATWCGPCNEELPHMKKIAQEHANDPFVMISISGDRDVQKWKDFIAKNGMTWMQYRDVGGTLSKTFDVNAIPHYFTIDSDGVLQSEDVGSGSLFDGKLNKMIKKAKTAQEATAKTSQATPQVPPQNIRQNGHDNSHGGAELANPLQSQ